jgi:putative isomerase
MKIAVIGAAGKAGSLIAAEARNRDYPVTAIVLPESADKVSDLYPVLPKSLFDLTADDLRAFDIVVDAFGTPFDKKGVAKLHVAAMEHLIEVMEQLPDIRLIIVGGAASLYEDERRIRLVADSIPREYRTVPDAMRIAFDLLRQSKVNWTFLSPAVTFDPKGKRTGHYILGSDYKILNPEGKSYISYADLAIAMVDEFRNAAFTGKRFTAVSDTSYNFTDRMVFDISSGVPFTRKGSYFGIYAESKGFKRGGINYGTGKLYIGSRRGGISQRRTNELIRIHPTYEGKKISYAVVTSPTELILRTAYGEVRCCMPETGLLYIKGENGLGLRLNKDMEIHEIMKKRPGKAWEGVFRWTCSCIFNPLKGDLAMNAPWDWEKLTTPVVEGDVLPDGNGEFLLSVDESEPAGFVRDTYPTYEEGLADVTADWQAFLAKIPHFVSPLEERRVEVSYILWSHIVGPAGKIKRPLMYMSGTGCASSWQMCQNALALHSDLDLAVELLLNMIDQIGPEGQFPDFYDDMRGIFQLTKPPQQGWVLKWIMKYHDLGTEVPHDKLEYMYKGYSRWANWHMEYRDDDHDGIPQYEHGDESGGDDNTIFIESPIMECPDLCAYLGLLFEALGDLARMLGKPDAEAEEWYQRSREIIRKMLDAFWNGERFVARVHGTRKVIVSESVQNFIPIILGKRLPQPVIDKIAETLSVEGDWLTQYGLASEKISSEDFCITGMSRGMVIPPTNLAIVTGLYDAGKEELAKKIAMRYCTTMRDGGIAMLINPLAGARGPGFSGSWPACAYVALANLCSNL